MSIEKIASGISNVVKPSVIKGANTAGKNINGALNKMSKGLGQKFLRTVEPTGSNNSFAIMASLMVFTVIIPRVLTASKRNPDNKEATKDEIKEILFRDVQTVLIILFALKSMNSIIAGLTSKINGLPMTNKPYRPLFESQEKGLKGIKEKATETLAHPIQKLKTLGKNILDTIHPTQGVKTLTNEEFISRYSGYSSIEQVKKLFDDIANQGGNEKNKNNAQKVFNKVMDSLIDNQKSVIAQQEKLSGAGIEATKKTKNATNSILNNLLALKEKGIEGLNDPELDPKVQQQIISFFEDGNNLLVKDAKGLNGVLRTVALAIESIYLGFGLPALNQRRLEKKYLNKEDTFPQDNNQGKNIPIPDKHIKAQEVKLYSSFIKQ